MEAPQFQVNPHWQFLREHYGMETAFAFFGPYSGAAVRIKILDRYTVESAMDLVPTNTNYVGSHFGGSLYSMCDPFYMFILMDNLGPDYIVWDKGAAIDFVKPGRGTVKARFHIEEEDIQKIRAAVAEKKKMDCEFFCEVRGESGEVVARIKKILYVRRALPVRNAAADKIKKKLAAGGKKKKERLK